MSPEDGWPSGLSVPARRALTAAGYARPEQLNGASAKALSQLHGMGPKALDLLREALGRRGLAP